MTELGWVDLGNGRRAYRPGKTGKTFGLDVAPVAGTFDPTHLSTRTITTVEGHTIPSPDDESVNGLLRRLIYLKGQLRAHEGTVKTLKAEIREVDDRIRTEWAEENINQAGIDGKTLYLYPVYHVEKVDGAGPADVRAALEASGLDYMLTPNYSGSSLLAYLKEIRDAGDEPPAALAAVVKLVPSSEVRVKDGPARTTPITY